MILFIVLDHRTSEIIYPYHRTQLKKYLLCEIIEGEHYDFLDMMISNT